MGITINGTNAAGNIDLGTNGTITNLAVGGLPNGSVNNADLASDVATALQYNDDKLQSNIAMLGFKTAINGSLAKYSLVDQIIDEYVDTSGVDASASTNEYHETGTYFGGSGGNGTGGTITSAGGYTYHKFTAGSTTFNAPSNGTVHALVVAGGGSGGSHHGGGGGAGTAIEDTALALTAGDYTLVVGTGGSDPGGTNQGNAGGDSTAFGWTAKGGGGGGCWEGQNGGHGGNSGGSGGTAGSVGSPGTANQSSATQSSGTRTVYGGNSGHARSGHATNDGWGGGIGHATNGSGKTFSNFTSFGVSGQFGYGGNGGGSFSGNNTHVSGGGNGYGGPDYANGGDATDGTGSGGGGGGGNNGTAGDGGDGVILLRYATGTFQTTQDLTLQSTATTATAAPTKADLILLIENTTGTATLNTDIKGYISRDGSAFSSAVTFVDEGEWGTNKKVIAAHDVDISGITSGTSMKYKITTHNQGDTKKTKIHAASLGWK